MLPSDANSLSNAACKTPKKYSPTFFSTFTILLFTLTLCVPCLGLPPFRYGWYTQLELLTAGLWFVGGLAALWNCILFKRQKKLTYYLWSMPVVWSWIPIISLSILVSLFQTAPLQSWSGSPQLADGIATFLSLLFLSPLFVLVGRYYKFKKWLLWIPTLVAIPLSTLTILGAVGTPVPSLRFWEWAPMFFPDYITFFALSLGIIYCYVRPSFARKRPLDILFTLLIGLIVFYAKNTTIYVGLTLSLFTYGALKVPLFKTLSAKKRLAYYAGAGLLTITLLICLTNLIRGDLPSSFSSLISRAHIGQFTFIQYLYGDMTTSKVLSFLFGNGWGDYNNAAVSNLTLTQDFQLFAGDKHQSTMEFVHRDQVNSHNIFLEYFLALGFVGFCLFCYLHYKIISTLKKSQLFLGTVFIITLGTLLVFWFQLPHTLMAITLAYCLLFSKTPSKISHKWIKTFLPLGALFSAATLFTFALVQGLSAYQYTKQMASRPGNDLFQKVEDITTTKWLLYDHLTGSHRSRQIVQGLCSDIFVYLSKSPHPKTQEAGESLLKITTHLQKDLPEGSSLTALILSLNSLSKFASHPVSKPLFDADPRYEKAWHGTAQLVAHHLPYRSDLFTPYFSHLITTNQGDKLKKLASYFLSKRSTDPISHWFLGAYYLQVSSEFNKGICLMKQALDHGIAKYIPLPPQQVDQIQQAASQIQCYKIL